MCRLSKNALFRPFIVSFVIYAFLLDILPIQRIGAQETFFLPSPDTKYTLGPAPASPSLKGIKIYPDNPFRFDFILDKGGSKEFVQSSRSESQRLVKYFLAALTIPEKDLWVNLSPYEKKRIIPPAFGLTDMGRDLLAEDYTLKQIAASILDPRETTGKKFWEKVYNEARKKYGTSDIPIDTFNKVWILPGKAVVYEYQNTAFVTESSLRVMLEEDYTALDKNTGSSKDRNTSRNTINSDALREILIPILTEEINTGKNFSRLRQIYNSLILSAWYKQKIKKSLLGAAYINQNKIEGMKISDNTSAQMIYTRYLEAFRKGVYNYIKEEFDPVTQETLPRKYFSGGAEFTDLAMASALTITTVQREKIIQDVSLAQQGNLETLIIQIQPVNNPSEHFYKHPEKSHPDSAMLPNSFIRFLYSKTNFQDFFGAYDQLNPPANTITPLISIPGWIRIAIMLKQIRKKHPVSFTTNELQTNWNDFVGIATSSLPYQESLFRFILPQIKRTINTWREFTTVSQQLIQLSKGLSRSSGFLLTEKKWMNNVTLSPSTMNRWIKTSHHLKSINDVREYLQGMKQIVSSMNEEQTKYLLTHLYGEKFIRAIPALMKIENRFDLIVALFNTFYNPLAPHLRKFDINYTNRQEDFLRSFLLTFIEPSIFSHPNELTVTTLNTILTIYNEKAKHFLYYISISPHVIPEIKKNRR